MQGDLPGSRNDATLIKTNQAVDELPAFGQLEGFPDFFVES